ncbi:TPA: hypothetical protein MFC62_003431 [Klebsiella pneumoniae]|nr:hypothetical protein [Klebsiella pneumoniae]
MTTDINEIIATLKPDLAIATNSKSPYSERYAAMDRATDILSLEVVCALVEALEKSQRANTAQDDHINQQQDHIDRLGKQNAELGKYARELESRTVKLPEAFYPDGDIDCPLVVELDDVKEMLSAAGIKVETE